MLTVYLLKKYIMGKYLEQYSCVNFFFLIKNWTWRKKRFIQLHELVIVYTAFVWICNRQSCSLLSDRKKENMCLLILLEICHGAMICCYFSRQINSHWIFVYNRNSRNLVWKKNWLAIKRKIKVSPWNAAASSDIHCLWKLTFWVKFQAKETSPFFFCNVCLLGIVGPVLVMVILFVLFTGSRQGVV